MLNYSKNKCINKISFIDAPIIPSIRISVKLKEGNKCGESFVNKPNVRCDISLSLRGYFGRLTGPCDGGLDSEIRDPRSEIRDGRNQNVKRFVYCHRGRRRAAPPPENQPGLNNKNFNNWVRKALLFLLNPSTPTHVKNAVGSSVKVGLNERCAYGDAAAAAA